MKILLKRTAFAVSTGACLGYSFNKFRDYTGLFGLRTAWAEAQQTDPGLSNRGGTEGDQAQLDGLTLKSVQIFFRHGARTPLKHVQLLDDIGEVPYDQNFVMRVVPHTSVPITVQGLEGGPRPLSKIERVYGKVEFKGGVHAGMLTSYGRQQMYELGRRLRDTYIEDRKFISPQFKPEEVYVRATNMNRTIHSLQSVLAGLYGVETFTSPVVVPVSNHENEVLYPNQRYCETLRRMDKHIWKGERQYPGVEALRKKISDHYGYKEGEGKPKVDLSLLRDHLVCRQAHGLKIPPFLQSVTPELDRLVSLWLTETLCGPKEYREWMMRLSIGPVFEIIRKNIDQCAKNKSQHKLFLYSAHDSTIHPMLVALGCHDSWPPYGADIRVELFEDKGGKHWVRTQFCGKDMTLKGCKGPLMTLDEFKGAVAHVAVTPDKWWCECQNRALGPSKPAPATEAGSSQNDEKLVPTGM